MLLIAVEDDTNYVDVMHEFFDAYQMLSNDKPVVDAKYFKNTIQKCIIYSSQKNKGKVKEIKIIKSKFNSIHVFEQGVYIYCFPFFNEGDLDDKRLSFSYRPAIKDELIDAPLTYIYPEHHTGDSSIIDIIGEEFIKSIFITDMKNQKIKDLRNNVDFLTKAMNSHTPPPPLIHLKKPSSSLESAYTSVHKEKEMSLVKPFKSNSLSLPTGQKRAKSERTTDDVFGIRNIMEIKSFLFGMEKEESVFSDSCIREESLLLRASVDLYTIKKDTVLRYLVMLSASMLDYPVVKLFSELYRLKFICADERKNVWYAFQGNKWNKLKDTAYVRTCIQEDFGKLLDLLIVRVADGEYQTERLSNHEKELVSIILEKQWTDQEIKTMNNIRKKCWTTNFSYSIFKSASIYLHSSSFIQELNRNPFLFGFENGVLDLNKGEFRKGYPDDFVSMSTNVSYVASDFENRRQLMIFLEKIFPDGDVLEYVLRFLASCLRSRNTDKIFSIWTGIGDNGKSVLVSLVEHAFGEYCAKVPTSLLVSKRSASSSATPELCIIEDRKIVFAQEPSEGERINPGLIKELTGGDTMYARALYEEGKNINVDAKLVLVSNKVPKVNEMTRAIWSRIRVVPFESLFVYEHEYEEETKKHPDKKVFIRDPNVTEKLKSLAPEFMSLLIEKYSVWLKEGLNEPEKISRLTEEVKMMNDSVGEFIRERVKKREGFKADKGEVYEVYQQWLKTNYPKKHPADVQSFNTQMNVHGLYFDKQGRYVDINL